MKTFKIIFPFVLLFLFQCTRQPNAPLNEIPESGKISFSIDMMNAPAEVVKMQGILSREGQDTVFFDFEMQDSTASALVENLASGFWTLQVDAYNSDHIIIYTGKARVNVQPGVVTPVYLHLNPTTGSLEIVVSWGGIDFFNSLVAYFPFDGNTNDLSKFHNHGLIRGNPSYTEGIHKLALKLDGIDDFVEINDGRQYNLKEKTICFWFKKENNVIRDTPGWDDVEGIVYKSWDTGVHRDFSFSIGNQEAPFFVVGVIWDGSDSLTVLKVRNIIFPGKWYFVTMVTKKHEAKFYLNGELMVSTAFSGELRQNDSPIVVGKCSYYSKDTRYFNGEIDEFAIFDRTLTDSEVKKLYNEKF